MRLSPLTKQRAKENFSFVLVLILTAGLMHVALTVVCGVFGIERGY